jgi:hypothetical protein
MLVQVPIYRTVQSLEINRQSGKINIICEEHKDGLISLLDVQEILRLAPEIAFFRYKKF